MAVLPLFSMVLIWKKFQSLGDSEVGEADFETAMLNLLTWVVKSTSWSPTMKRCT